MRIRATMHPHTMPTQAHGTPPAAAPAALPSSALRQALYLALLFAALKLALHVGTNAWEAHLGYGYFRDELYYIICGRFLDWGYVDHSPMVALQARLGIALFGKSLVGIRLFSALAGAAKVFLTGLLAWSLGGRRAAQALAMLGVLMAPQFLGIDSYLSMNSFEPVFWMSAMLAIILLVRGNSPRWWLVVGLAGGLGLENKPSMLLFLVALLAGLLFTPQRKLLYAAIPAPAKPQRMLPYFLAAVALIFFLALPNALWQWSHGWPTLEFLHNGRVENKNVVLAPIPFLLNQVQSYNPLSVFLWGAGLVWLFASRRARSFRWIGWTYLVFLALMMALHAKDYYLAPIYPVLFAAGGIVWESLLRSRKTAWLVPSYAAILIITGVLILPMAIPVLRPPAWIAYTTRLHLRSGNTENQRLGPLPQFYADRFGWQELADNVTQIYRSLSPQDRAKAGIVCSNYGEASAINFLAPSDVPFAVSGHNNYYLWGPHGYTGEVLIVINGDRTPDKLRKYFASVEVAGEMNHPYSMPYEHRHIYLCRGLKVPLASIWASKIKEYI